MCLHSFTIIFISFHVLPTFYFRIMALLALLFGINRRFARLRRFDAAADDDDATDDNDENNLARMF